ncbi:hypothetical protein MNBD_ALPHA06-1969 [hydrothermal vent metagenome]|uniref:Molybdate ABC transporter substrate-binding protein n=1 Tax=hydrothermal vent metagenome TaxID=652676 RepID=A0A3B0SQ00_9ZZZZ
MRRLWLFLLLVPILSCAPPKTPRFYIASASSFAPPLIALTQQINETCQVAIRISFGSTGKLVAQMGIGGPHQLMISADTALSHKLAQMRPDIVIESPFVRSPMAYWQPQDLRISDKIAIANPQTAPFGRAAMQVLRAKHPDGVLPDLVTANSASAAFSYVYSGVALAGYVPLSMLMNTDIPAEEYQVIEPTLYAPILLQNIQLKSGPKTDCVINFLANAELSKFGYQAP